MIKVKLVAVVEVEFEFGNSVIDALNLDIANPHRLVDQLESLCGACLEQGIKHKKLSVKAIEAKDAQVFLGE